MSYLISPLLLEGATYVYVAIGPINMSLPSCDPCLPVYSSKHGQPFPTHYHARDPE